MKLHRLQDMRGGWFVGDFLPTCLRTSAVEVSYKTYSAGEAEVRHMHRIATEVTLVAYGRIAMNDCEYAEGDVVVLSPGEASTFRALEASATVVVKMPSVVGDKYTV